MLPAPFINSVGTVITPIDSDAPNLNHSPRVSSDRYEQGSQPMNRDHMYPDQPDATSYTQLPQLMPTYFIPASGPQQVYDPVQQRYFTLTPSAPNGVPLGPGVQPQYPIIPSSPQPPQINTGNYFKQFASQGNGSSHLDEPLLYPGNGGGTAGQLDGPSATRNMDHADVADVST